MNVSTRQLHGFVLAAELGSFSRAAERLHITQAGLSKMVRELEAQLGTRLFDRTTRTVALTPAGQKLFPAARRAVEELDMVGLEIDQIDRESRKTLRVGATPLIACKVLPAVCARFQKTNPEVTVRLLELQQDRIRELVLEGSLDLGLGIFLKGTEDLERTTLFKSPLICVSPRRLGRVGKTPEVGTLRWKDITGDQLVSLQADNPSQQLVEQYVQAHCRLSQARYPVNHIETQIAMVEIGTGPAIVPSFALPACSYYKVQVDTLKDPVVEVPFSAISKKGRPPSEAIIGFNDALVQLVLEKGLGHSG